MYKKLIEKETSIDNIYTFYYDKNGYINTTGEVTGLLTNNNEKTYLTDVFINTLYGKTTINRNIERSVGVNPYFEFSANVSSMVPMYLEFDMAVQPLDLEDVYYPYLDISKHVGGKVLESDLSNYTKDLNEVYSNEIIESVLSQKEEKQQIFHYGKAWASSSGEGEAPRNSIDLRKETYWSAKGTEWNAKKRPQTLYIQLPKIRTISSISWLNHHLNASPKDYVVEVSKNGLDWEKVVDKKNAKGKPGGSTILEEFSPVNIKMIRISIFETFQDSPPGIDEVYFNNATLTSDALTQESIINCPFCFVADAKMSRNIFSKVLLFPNVEVSWITNRDGGYSKTNSQSLEISADGRFHNYRVILPPRGTLLEKVRIDSFNYPVNVNIQNVTVMQMNLEEMKNSKLYN
ncbi:discoidin domain-containing protein [Candidatus Microgenomates bacterium]|nr:discoidin domain-containing protein [Candidatus Microgenomates bacterium]